MHGPTRDMPTSADSHVFEELYGDMPCDSATAEEAPHGSPALSMTIGELEALYGALARKSSQSAPLLLTTVEDIARELGLRALQLDIVCQMVTLAAGGRPRAGGTEAAPDFDRLELADFSALLQRQPPGLAADDIVSLPGLIPGDPAPDDVFSVISVEMLRTKLSPRALRALDLRELRLILEALWNSSKAICREGSNGQESTDSLSGASPE